MGRRLRLWLLGAAVALAFADSSIVVLALPDLIGEFETSVTGVSFVVTAYNLAVAVAALALVRGARQIRPARLAAGGLALFLVASLACAAAPGLEALIAFRSLQGLGGAALLAGSLPLARGLARTPEHGVSFWALAGAVGAAVGPAAGGALTQAFDWRAIFLAQAPVAAAALLALVGTLPAEAPGPRGPASRRAAANTALALVSGALVGALFLVVLLLIDVWRLSPLAAAAVVSAVPAGTLAARVLAAGLAALVTGGLVLAAGLAALALLPGSHTAWPVAALACCGLGLGLTVPPLTRAALSGGEPAASGTWTVGARHLGLVAALAVATPLLAHDLDRGGVRAERAGAALVLDARLDVATKVPLAIDLAREIERTPHGSLPDFDRQFAERRAGGAERTELDRLRAGLEETMRAVVTRSFRRSFAFCALLALLALVPLALLRRAEAP
ncbi:MAG: MFS transporter [Gaiellaceae bacterium]